MVRVYAGSNGRKADDTDAHSIALVGLNSTDLPVVARDEVIEQLRLLSRRRSELVARRTQIACRIHRDLVELVPGGVSKRITAKHANETLARIRPRDEIAKLRRQLLVEQVTDLVAVDRQIAASTVELKKAVAAAPTRLTKLFGFGGDQHGAHPRPGR